MKKNNVVGINEMTVAARKSLYEAVKRNLNPLFEVDGVVIAKTGAIPIELLEIDPAYQGDRRHTKINRLVANFDYRKLDLITVVPHDETCLFEVVDGQGRTMAANILNIPTLQAKILMDAPSDPVERQKYEAAIFVRQDEQTERVKPVEKHKAMVLNGDMTATILDKILNKYNVDYVNHGGQRSERVLGSYETAFRIAKAYGEDCLEFIFSIIENAGWGGESNGYSAAQFIALKNIYSTHNVSGERMRIARFFSDEFRTTTPELVMASAKSKYPKRDSRTGLTIFLDDMLVEEGISKRTYYTDGENGKVSIIKTADAEKVSA